MRREQVKSLNTSNCCEDAWTWLICENCLRNEEYQGPKLCLSQIHWRGQGTSCSTTYPLAREICPVTVVGVLAPDPVAAPLKIFTLQCLGRGHSGPVILKDLVGVGNSESVCSLVALRGTGALDLLALWFQSAKPFFMGSCVRPGQNRARPGLSNSCCCCCCKYLFLCISNVHASTCYVWDTTQSSPLPEASLFAAAY